MDVVANLPLATIFTPTVVRWTVWSGLVLMTIALLVLMRTKWGHAQPLRKCIGEGARDDVGAGTRQQRHDDAQRFGGKFLRRGGDGQRS